ncbi:sugar ABC transporter substrate-binding protein [Prosthecomicrobium hirschii]|uniref:Sugar ABC transporter substrate-binding protein n=2 Tax=Prosthecodimorpha hirschii TaxID=665126 RepID=A0A0P6VYU3_9HYPH|nr:polysaccharide biosynthesis/export family protein [Prosthecomicrobium hirschii]KPL51904.1 sugar ABC transporter substrate-binding protein [Prosthecomicrobium hirschii]
MAIATNLILRGASIAVLVGGLMGCSMLPAAGPGDGAIEGGASASVKSADAVALKYALVDIGSGILDFLTDPGPGSLYGSFGGGRGPSPELQIGVGDIIQVSIFESAAGGLFIPNEAGSRPGNFVTLPQQTVDKAGFISVPYAGLIRAGGRTLAQVQREIEQKLVNRAIEPQAIVALVDQRSNEVTVVGDVGAPKKLTLNAGGDRMLDVIAKAGGIVHPGYETYVTLQRRGKRATVFFNSLIERPVENIFAVPGDTIYVYREQRAFLAFGATGLSGQFKFEQERLNLSDAVGKAGGLMDDRADPGQVFVYRVENRAALEKMGVDLAPFDPDQKKIPTIFRTNFRDPSSFFASQKFPMRDADIVYVSNADQVELFKFLSLVTGVTGATAQVGSDAASVKSSIRTLRR